MRRFVAEMVMLIALCCGLAPQCHGEIVTKIAAGAYHTVALKNDGTVWAWGSNVQGQLGDGTTTRRPNPMLVPNFTGATAIAAGDSHTVALKNDGTVWTWGNNYYGQLGNGTLVNSSSPVQVSGLTGVVAIACGEYHTLAVKNDGTLWAWGNNMMHQLGNGTTINSLTPGQVSNLAGVVGVAAGSDHSAAVKNDGTVWAWGYNRSGQIGDGTTIERSTPVQIAGLTGVKTIYCGNSSTIAVQTDGTVWACGGTGYSQAADPTIATEVPSLAGTTSIAYGRGHSLVLKSDGTVWARGDNWAGQLGDGTTTTRSTPVQTSGLTNIVAIAAGDSHSAAVASDGSVWAWGSNNYGQVGGDGYPPRLPRLVVWQTKVLSASVRPTLVAGGDTMSISVDAPYAASVTADGVALYLSNDRWISDITASPVLGPHAINVVARDGAGNPDTNNSAIYKTAPIFGTSIKSLKAPIMNTARDNFLFKCWGKVTITNGIYYLEDGSGSKVKVSLTEYTSIAGGNYASARGVLDPTADIPVIKASLGAFTKLK